MRLRSENQSLLSGVLLLTLKTYTTPAVYFINFLIYHHTQFIYFFFQTENYICNCLTFYELFEEDLRGRFNIALKHQFLLNLMGIYSFNLVIFMLRRQKLE